jgi:hypothetical protein
LPQKRPADRILMRFNMVFWEIVLIIIFVINFN